MREEIFHRVVAMFLKNSFFLSLKVILSSHRTIRQKDIVRFWSCDKVVVIIFRHKAKPSYATSTG